MTHFQMTHNHHDDVWTFSGAISGYDLVRVRLTTLDRALMDQHNDISDPLYSANMLLVLEMLFRRMAEQNPAQKETPDLSDRG
jgi:hypothetical protein